MSPPRDTYTQTMRGQRVKRVQGWFSILLEYRFHSARVAAAFVALRGLLENPGTVNRKRKQQGWEDTGLSSGVVRLALCLCSESVGTSESDRRSF